ncbi:hypothetical protein CLIM01_00096 [Colletotrichum limetticola]|uniref:Uncharacterized protein n=1 Tax=Colletotrichum limetticola TaxID=1209924 RepID=A0ABQ9QG60_9PEZI|nr:hypothetical protein CLIM01_00096 [Colletotrichum limetticola]
MFDPKNISQQFMSVERDHLAPEDRNRTQLYHAPSCPVMVVIRLFEFWAAVQLQFTKVLSMLTQSLADFIALGNAATVIEHAVEGLAPS